MVGVTLAAGLTAGAVRADDEAGKNEARALQREGARLLEAGDAAAALPLFRSADAKYASAKILVNIGSALKALDRNAEAADAYARYLAAPDTDPARKAEITALLTKLDRTLGRIELTVAPADAEVAIAGRDWERTTATSTWRAAPGTVVVRARKPGYADGEATVVVEVGEASRLALTLELAVVTPDQPDPPPTGDGPVGEVGIERPVTRPAARGMLGVSARVIVDGQGRGAAGAVGALVGLGSRVELHAAAIVGPAYGMYAGVSAHVAGRRWRPVIAAGLPVFFDDGARMGVRGAVGLEWRATHRVSVLAELGAEYMFRRATDIDAWVLAPALAAEVRP